MATEFKQRLMQTFLSLYENVFCLAVLVVLASNLPCYAADRFEGIDAAAGFRAPKPKNDTETRACRSVAFLVVDNLDLPKGETLDGLVKVCNNNPDQQECRDFAIYIEGRGKKSPLNCKAP